MPVSVLTGGQTASFSLRKFKKKDIRKGMVIVAPSLQPTACWEFDGEILVLHHPTTISPKYQAMGMCWIVRNEYMFISVHCGPIRQTATILSMSQECLRTGDKAICRFRFIKNPEYLRIGTRLVFREGRTKAVGNVLQCYSQAPPPSLQPLSRRHQGAAAAAQHNDGNNYIWRTCIRDNCFQIIRRSQRQPKMLMIIVD